LGATPIEEDDAYNFALYSKHAESVMLLLYTENDIVNPVLAYRFDYLKNKSGRIWHCRIPLASMSGASYYAYSVEGPEPNGGFEWHWFDREKILLDPYAKSVFFPPTFDRLAAVRPGSNAGKAPLGVLAGDSEGFDWQGDHGLRHEADTIIYELHVGGFTKNLNSGAKHEADIEVVLDVVYNHTGEGDHTGPVYTRVSTTAPTT
jgi:isoamylase